MILVADSGSTNTNWVLIEGKKISSSFNTIGINPYFISSKEIIVELESNIPQYIIPLQIRHIYFYGSGCSNNEQNLVIFNALNHIFPNSGIEINSDLLGAARALFFKEKGIAVILGTGSNTCIYDGEKITKAIMPLGYILGNEGGGDFLGKLLITDFLNDELPDKIRDKLISKYTFSKSDIMQAIYKKPFPNRFLASFCEFISENNDNTYIKSLLQKSFTELFNKHICKYENYSDYTLRGTGSIAFHFQKDLNAIASLFNTKFDHFEKEPIIKLAQFHINSIDTIS